MVKRLVLFLLIACLALPATAVPLVGTTPPQGVVTANPCHGDEPARDQSPFQSAKHQCIGCVPLATACADVPAPSELRGIVGAAALVHRLVGLNDHPATPPPRD
jgi:hypothetical protein